MIVGIGTDILDTRRKKNILNKYDQKFIDRIYGKNEIQISQNKFNKSDNYFAKRFAAKEALSKSFGTGIRDNLSFKDIEILNDKMGKPFFYKSKKIDRIIKKKFKIKKYDLFLSLSDEKDHSIAFTILVKR